MNRTIHLLWCAAALALSAGCRSDPPPPLDPTPPMPSPGFEVVEAEPQRAGDAERGYTALVSEGYVSCGVPRSIYESVFGTPSERSRLPGRTGWNAQVPYFFTGYTNADGVELVTGNCLSCHASWLEGELVVGLGDTFGDFTASLPQGLGLAGLLLKGAEREAWHAFADHIQVIAPYIQTRVVGTNPGDSIAAALFAHRDPETLAWSQTPLMDPPGEAIPLDVPPWWRMRKKNAMFYTGAGRGDQVRIMMTASTLCADSVGEAEAIEAYFDDIRAYILSIEPPAWPHEVDSGLAHEGRQVFEATCSACHGTYGDDASYPNVIVPLDVVGTDPTLAVGTSQFSDRFVTWFSRSFYGERSRLEPRAGYMAPPLDGIWATAPYLHNGSVPNLATLLDSSKRPRYWRRTYRSRDYDPDTLGWIYAELEEGHEALPEGERKWVYDTTLPGYANTGHAFGDALTDAEREALLEYLKTL